MIKKITKALCEKYQKFHQDGIEEYLLTIVVNPLCRSMLKLDSNFSTKNSNVKVVNTQVTIDGWRVVVCNSQKELFRIVVR